MTYEIKFSPLNQLAELEAKRAYRYNYKEIGDKVGLPRQTVRHIFTQNPKRIDIATLAKILAFFNAEGLNVTLSDLFTVTPIKS